MLINEIHSNMINSPVRSLQGKAVCYDAVNALAATYTYTDALKSYSVERVGEGTFFGYGFVQKANIKLLDPNRQLEFTTGHKFKLLVGVNNDYVTSFPWFKVTEVNRDENTNELSITAYDKLKGAAEHTYGEVDMAGRFGEATFTISELATFLAQHISITSARFVNVTDGLDKITFTTNLINLEGTETIREVFDAIAEFTQTIYYLDASNLLVFKRLDKDGAAALTISRSEYITLKSKTNRRLAKITKANSLGDNIHIELTVTGTEQVIMDNPFYELRDDVADLLEPARASMLGLCINQFECAWRGNHLLEIGDKIDLVTKDGATVSSYLLDDTFTYNGALSQSSKWQYGGKEESDHSDSSTVGEALKQTFAKVDKVNKQIDIVVSDVSELEKKQSAIQLTTDNLSASVEDLERKAALTMTSEEVKIEIQKAVEDIDSDEITTSTGYTFNADGLKVEKTGSEMSTQITEDGMVVNRSGEAVLQANNEGVKAEDLHATTYLLIGKNSRFEDFGDNRTGCFWIGSPEEEV